MLKKTAALSFKHADFNMLNFLELIRMIGSYVLPYNARNLNTSDSALHHTISLMYVGARHFGFGIT